MPTYDYLCPNGHRFEVIHGVTADGPATCPVCHEGPVRKVFSAPTFHFKGSGWAKKDRSTASRSKAASASSDSESGAGSDAGAGAGSGTDKGQGSSTDGAASSDAKPAAGKTSPGDTSSGETGKSTGSSITPGPTTAD